MTGTRGRWRPTFCLGLRRWHPDVEIQAVLALLGPRGGGDCLRACWPVLCGIEHLALLQSPCVLRGLPPAKESQYTRVRRTWQQGITYRFCPPVVAANGIPRKTELPLESVKPFTLPSWRDATPSATTALAALGGSGLAPATAAWPRTPTSERLCRPLMTEDGTLMMQGAGRMAEGGNYGVWVVDADLVRASTWLYT